MTGVETSIQDVFVSNVMNETIRTVSADAPATDAARRLFEADIGSLLVGADAAPPTGIVTESDFVELVATGRDPATTTVAQCMSSPVVTVSTTRPLAEAAALMADENVKKLPVVAEETDEIAGIITTTDIAKYVPVHEFHPDE
jgi:signal-transduction protein with cAMP-binding, CBS, and nucleotidyltransferase domain